MKVFHKLRVLPLPRSCWLSTQQRFFSPPKSRAEEQAAFEEKMRQKQQSPIEEEDHQEGVSFEGTNMYLKAFLLSASIALSGVLLNWYAKKKVSQRKAMVDDYIDERSTAPKYGNMVKDDQLGGPWELKDCSGSPFGSQELEGSYYLLYFGYSKCPDTSLFAVMKMSKALRAINNSNEAKQYFKVKQVFVTVNPDVDTPEALKEFTSLFSHPIIALREESSMAPNLLQMLRLFKVPAGLNAQEKAAIKSYFQQKEHELYSRQSGLKARKRVSGKLGLWWSKRKEKYDESSGCFESMADHSRVFYLMGPDNQCIGFYDLDIGEEDLAERVLEDVSFDFGVRVIGNKNKEQAQD